MTVNKNTTYFLLLHLPLLGTNVFLRFLSLRQCLTLSFTDTNMLFIL